MSSANRPNRKASDKDIIELNSLGLSLGTIGDRLGTHPTTITLRLRSLGVPPADTRRAFMDHILKDFSDEQERWLIDQLGPHISIRDYLKSLLVREYVSRSQ